MERIVAGTEPTCRLSLRAQAALTQIRNRLPFVDGETLPIVSTGKSRIMMWAFAGGAATASIAAGLTAQGLPVTGFDDLSITLRSNDPIGIAKVFRSIDPDSVHPRLPDDLEAALKFGLCLPDKIIEMVLKARLSDPSAVASTCRREPRLISANE
jgi:hypothetical protein